MTDWSKPTVVDLLTQAFPARIMHLLPAYEDIPPQFKQDSGTAWNTSQASWNAWQAKWFYRGLDENDLPTPVDGVDYDIAMRHLKTIQGSWEPKHEHKEAAVAYLASLWFKPQPAGPVGPGQEEEIR